MLRAKDLSTLWCAIRAAATVRLGPASEGGKSAASWTYGLRQHVAGNARKSRTAPSCVPTPSMRNISRSRPASTRKLSIFSYNVFQTLFDGKCVNTLVDNPATTRCPMCLKTSHQFGNVNEDFTPREESLLYGLSLLHAEIKAFEHLLHLSYRLHLEQWDVRADMK
ncbi:unnamed protein product, partial [Trichogramma brassicae]